MIEDVTAQYRRRRDQDPPITVYWIATPSVGRPVPLNGFSCPWCKTTIFDNMVGTIGAIINAPVDLQDFSTAWTARCKMCKQNWRFVTLQVIKL